MIRVRIFLAPIRLKPQPSFRFRPVPFQCERSIPSGYGGSDEYLASAIGLAVMDKKEKHAGMENIDVVHNRPWILIGG